jgi:hypothetical protein
MTRTHAIHGATHAVPAAQLPANFTNALWTTFCSSELDKLLSWKAARPFAGAAARLRVDNPGRDRSVPWYWALIPDRDPATGKAHTIETARKFYLERQLDGKTTFSGPYPLPVRGLTPLQAHAFVDRISARQVGKLRLDYVIEGRLGSSNWRYEFGNPQIVRAERAIVVPVTVLRPVPIRGSSDLGQGGYTMIGRPMHVPSEGKWQLRVVDDANGTVLGRRTIDIKGS